MKACEEASELLASAPSTEQLCCKVEHAALAAATPAGHGSYHLPASGVRWGSCHCERADRDGSFLWLQTGALGTAQFLGSGASSLFFHVKNPSALIRTETSAAQRPAALTQS